MENSTAWNVRRSELEDRPANKRHSPNDVSMLVQRLRWWANIEIALREYLVFAGDVTVLALGQNLQPGSHDLSGRKRMSHSHVILLNFLKINR